MGWPKVVSTLLQRRVRNSPVLMEIWGLFPSVGSQKPELALIFRFISSPESLFAINNDQAC
jgi:hypothetical protein